MTDSVSKNVENSDLFYFKEKSKNLCLKWLKKAQVTQPKFESGTSRYKKNP